MLSPSAPRGHLATEQANPQSVEFDALSIAEAVRLVQREDASVHAALERAADEVARAIELVVERLRRGGRLIYVGAGTSGRLGALDAAECPPTFQSPPSAVQAVLAGGERAMRQAVEGAEDDRQGAVAELTARALAERDVVFGISAGGTTPFVHGALEFARSRGAATVFLACVPFDQAPDHADVSIRVVTGPEIVAGSTRLKAGTATKLVLNTVTTVAMAQLGKVHGNLMVDVDTRANRKLVERGARIVSAITGASRTEALELLRAADGQVKLAVVMRVRAIDRERARALLETHHGSLRRALGSDRSPATTAAPRPSP
jgi:N-acetylmuramic acid 6-phosphate etherase